MVGGIEQSRRLAVERQHIYVLDQKRNRERQAERRKAELLLDTDGDRYEHQRPHILRLEDQRTEKHKSGKKDVQDYERSLSSDAQSIHSGTYHHCRKIGGIKA